jgi:hypothetical protein
MGRPTAAGAAPSAPCPSAAAGTNLGLAPHLEAALQLHCAFACEATRMRAGLFSGLKRRSMPYTQKLAGHTNMNTYVRAHARACEETNTHMHTHTLSLSHTHTHIRTQFMPWCTALNSTVHPYGKAYNRWVRTHNSAQHWCQTSLSLPHGLRVSAAGAAMCCTQWALPAPCLPRHARSTLKQL